MTRFLIPYAFIPGTKAKAQEVNANFTAIQDELNTKAIRTGDVTQPFLIANATEANHAISKTQFEALSLDLTTNVKNNLNKELRTFCVRSGNLDSNGNADLLSNAGLIVSFKVGGNYPKLEALTTYGSVINLSAIADLNMSGKANGTYNIFVDKDGVTSTFANTIYIKKKIPTMVQNDVWLDVSSEPIRAYQFNGTSNLEFERIPIGSLKIENSAITEIKTFQYNQNGYNVNFQTQGYRMPDYSLGINQSSNTAYFADNDRFVVVHITYNSIEIGTVPTNYPALIVSQESSFRSFEVLTHLWCNVSAATNATLSGFVPKGYYYKLISSANPYNGMRFFTLKGAN